MTEHDIAQIKGEIIDEKHTIVGSGVLFQEAAQKYLKQCKSNIDTKQGYKISWKKLDATLSFSSYSSNHI